MAQVQSERSRLLAGFGARPSAYGVSHGVPRSRQLRPFTYAPVGPPVNRSIVGPSLVSPFQVPAHIPAALAEIHRPLQNTPSNSEATTTGLPFRTPGILAIRLALEVTSTIPPT